MSPGSVTAGIAALLWLAIAPVSTFAEDPLITEFLALGGDLDDEDGDTPDWIEIENPGPGPIDLEGWYLTDDVLDLTKWRFPSTPLGVGEYVVVFASGKDRAQAGAELHANFQLNAAGEFLALVKPDGMTVAHAFAPAFPEQYEDRSFGLALSQSLFPFVSRGAVSAYRVPVDASEDASWRLPGFDDALWPAGPTGFGYDDAGTSNVPADELVNVAPLGTVSQSSTLAGYAAALAIDGDYGDFTHTQAGSNLPATWTVELDESYRIHSIVLYNRSSCCQSRLRDITVTVLDAPGGNEVFVSDLLNAENEMGGGGTGGPDFIEVDFVDLLGGPIGGRVVRVVRTPDPDLSGTGGAGNNDEADVLSLGEVEILATSSAYATLIDTDVGDDLRGAGTSLYLRIPFVVEGGAEFDTLRLRMRYDDGFVAYINGTEVARRNAPASLGWSSAATAERSADDAVAVEEIDLTDHIGALSVGDNVLAVHVLNSSADDGDLLLLPELEGRSTSSLAWLYFQVPSPGEPNDPDGVLGVVADTKFSHDRGFYDAPFDLEITTASEGAEIRYTLDGSVPTESQGTAYSGPIRIDGTTTVRARAFLPGLEPTNTDTHTYLFIDDVPRQTHQATVAAGFPSSWGGTGPDYGMDPDVVGPNDRYGGLYADSIRDDLLSLPTLSIVMDIDDMFGSRGIYTNSQQHGLAWERPASVELLPVDDDPGFQVRCGIRIQGGYFRQHSATRKHSLRLLFKDEYGPTKLRFPLFGKRAVQRFDTITLRAGANDGYSWNAARNTEQYARDEFGRSLQRATGNAGSHGTFVHLYINGFYWGLYNPAERPDHSFSASYYGGDKEDWDSVHDGATTNGTLTAWNQMIQATATARTSLDAYYRLQGLSSDGTPLPGVAPLLDVHNYIDYLVVNVWGGNWDWPWKNYWAGRDRSEASTGFKFYCWDFENTMGNNRDRSDLGKNALQNNFSGAGSAHQNLQSNPEYRLHFADHVHRHLFNGGILTPESLIPRYDELSGRVERAIVAESARWGDQHYNPPLTLAEWATERTWILDYYLPRRTDVVLNQLKAAQLYPNVEAPLFQRQGGLVDAGFPLVITAPAGTVYYTLDGTDPRLPGGAVSPSAIEVSEQDPVVLLAPDASLRYLVPVDDSLGLGWVSPDFDDSAWLPGQGTVGYERSSGYETYIDTNVESVMYDKNTSIYLRMPFELDPDFGVGGGARIALVSLGVQYDDGFFAYLNGELIDARNAPEAPTWDARARVSHSDSLAVEYEEQVIADAAALLRPGRNVLAIQAMNTTASGADFLIGATIYGTPTTGAISIHETTTVLARAWVGDTWSALNEATFVVDTPLRVTEIMYHPAPPPVGSPFESTDFEFLEIQNVGTERVELAGVRIDGGIRFEFSEGSISGLDPSDLAVIVRNRDAFLARYPGRETVIAGQYRGRLANDGDVITFLATSGEPILDFDYSDDWHPETDGEGPSLVIADALAPTATWGLAAGWSPSAYQLGSPGVDESAGPIEEGWQLPADLNQDARLDLSDAISVLQYLFVGTEVTLPCGGGSPDHPGNVALLDSDADGDVVITDAIYLLNYLFLGGSPPPRGTECISIPGCPDVCR